MQLFGNMYLFLSLLLLVLLSACGPLQVEKHKRFFWPPPPDEAKLEYVNFYVEAEDVRRGVDTRLREAILGKDYPRPIFSQPYSAASNSAGIVYVTDLSGNRLLAMDLVRHELRTAYTALDGPPQKVVCDKFGDVWLLVVAKEPYVRRLDKHEQPVGELIPLLKSGRPASIAVDRDRSRLYVTYPAEHQIKVFALDGTYLAAYGRRGLGPGEFNFPTDLDLDDDGNLYIVDALNARVQLLSPDGEFIRMFGERGTASGSFSVPKAITVSPSGLVYVTDGRFSKVVIFNTLGEYLLNFGGQVRFEGQSVTPGGLYMPTGIDADRNETVWIVDLFNVMVHEYQYLTADYLAMHPIKPEDVYYPEPAELESVTPITEQNPLPR